MLTLEPGQALRMIIGGGGGWGDPLDRDPQQILADIEDGLYSPAFVKRAFGVVVGRSGLDAEATASTREALNISQADDCGCHIITAPDDVIAKLAMRGKSPEEMSLDTVKTFFADSTRAGFKL